MNCNLKIFLKIQKKIQKNQITYKKRVEEEDKDR